MSTTTISIDEVREARAADRPLVLLDCRTGAEFESAHIPGSVNVPLDRFDEFVGSLADLDVDLVTVCQSGPRAQQAQTKLATAGVSSVRVLGGGVAAWEKAGAPLDRGRERWAMDRQVRGVAGGLSLLGLLVGTRFRAARAVSWVVAAGLTYSALSNTCYMAQALAKLPYNRTDADPAPEVERIVAAHGRRALLAAR